MWGDSFRGLPQILCHQQLHSCQTAQSQGMVAGTELRSPCSPGLPAPLPHMQNPQNVQQQQMDVCSPSLSSAAQEFLQPPNATASHSSMKGSSLSSPPLGFIYRKAPFIAIFPLSRGQPARLEAETGSTPAGRSQVPLAARGFISEWFYSVVPAQCSSLNSWENCRVEGTDNSE